MSIFRSTRNFDLLLEKATSHLLMEPDWDTTMQICDLIRQNDVQPKHAVSSLKKKLTSTNPHSALYALLVLESIVKNCGVVVLDEIATKPFCDFLNELCKTTAHEKVRSKLLELIQTWNFAFRKNSKYGGVLKELMNTMKVDGHKFPVLRESDAMFASDTAPEWADGDVCHRCRVQFNVIQRKHHCRACGQVFCGQCTSKTSTLPKFGIEKEVRVCDACYDEATKPSAASKAAISKAESELPEEYLKSSLAQQKQDPPKKTEDELREEEEFQLALALSQSEAEAKEKEKFKTTSSIYQVKVEPTPVEKPATPPQQEETNPELAIYLNRSYWESLQTNDQNEQGRPTSPSAPATAPTQTIDNKYKTKENGLVDNDLEEFMKTLKSHVEIFINRMKSNSSRGRSITNDTSVQTLFMNITAMHSRLLHYIQEHDDSRIHFERLQDKLTQVKDARAALDDLREEHNEKLRREAEEQERMRQLQMAHKLEVMRKKKEEYLQYQRQLALQRIQEQEREMHMRQEQQKQQYMMPQYGYIGSPVHGQQFPPNMAPQIGNYNTYPYPQQPMMPPGQIPINQGPPHGPRPTQQPHNPVLGPPPGFAQGPTSTNTISNNPPYVPHGVASQTMIGMPTVGIPPGHNPQTGMSGMPLQQAGIPQAGSIPPQPNSLPHQHGGISQNQVLPQGQVAPQFQQPGAPPASPQVQSNGEAQTAELISFD
ncbi:hepatocyte growth factor-regulated tyrosine kinase substrate-like isoform X1 [Diorhabda carinulata]|uniref:hepatocyte growth factor-regulated tyrosine kinase substrate-like isoform X1 n=1 Tax=Diorhabda carinulata TaxID=1163345 RepID=UPI0025A0A601|nr:hepatocyte growth factor-regulated tyrosine kinase substrate-like isoform X1 [Diorhabda carinulata]